MRRPVRIGVWHGYIAGYWALRVNGTEPPGLNVLLRMHWRARKRRQEDLSLMLQSQGTLPKFKGPVLVRYRRSYRTSPLDKDNLYGSFKMIGDVLRDLKVVEDDKPAILELVAEQELRGAGGPRFMLEISRRAPAIAPAERRP